MQVRVNSHMPFGGQQWRPGDKIPEDVWMLASDSSRRALVSQGLVRLSGVDGEQGAGVDISDLTARLAALEESNVDLSAKLDRALEMLGKLGGGVEPVKSKRRRAAASE